MEFKLDTGLNVESSRKAADLAIAEYAKKFPQYNPFLNWTGETTGEFGFSAAGNTIKGSAQVQEGSIRVEFKELPFLARLLIPSAMETVKAEVKLWAAKVAGN